MFDCSQKCNDKWIRNTTGTVVSPYICIWCISAMIFIYNFERWHVKNRKLKLVHIKFLPHGLYTKKYDKIRNTPKVWFNKVLRWSVIVGNNLNIMEKIIEEHVLCSQRLMATSNDLQQVLDGYIKYPENSIPPISTPRGQSQAQRKGTR